MKTKTVISMLVAAVCAFVAQQAKANFFTATDTVTLSGADTPAIAFTLTTTVTEAVQGGLYDYSYALTPNALAVAIALNSVTVTGVGGGPFVVTGLTGVSSLNPFFTETTADVIAQGWATWTGTPPQIGAELFGFYSPYGPTYGTAVLQDSQQYLTPPSGSANTLVPGLPDGGMTVVLLGGALTAMGLISKTRKLN